MPTQPLPYLGFGLGLRKDHYQDILATLPQVDWFEILTENYLVPGGKPLYYLDQIHEHYPMVMHGVSLSIGSHDPLNFEYLDQVKMLAERVDAQWISDHLCWTGQKGINAHDLLPLPYTEEAIKHVAGRVQQVQDYLGRQILMENVSSYVTYQQSGMEEWDFLGAIADEADCLILLDINNIYVSSVNHEFNPTDYLNGIPTARVQQLHLAGHRNLGDYIIDTHDEPIVDDVWSLYAAAVKRFGKVSTMIERDDNIPELPVLLDELEQAKHIAQSINPQAAA
ncbi:MAG TPA: DUF692 domain-containing protein [Gammaproteobacteria bacterium]|nr:DUF692 domain-containing protein [Gammaproteobacteria bacterium]